MGCGFEFESAVVGFIFQLLFWSAQRTLLPSYFLIQSIVSFDFLNFYVDPPLTSLVF